MCIRDRYQTDIPVLQLSTAKSHSKGLAAAMSVPDTATAPRHTRWGRGEGAVGGGRWRGEKPVPHVQ
eukprot:2473638-Rhodomonas_salina.1